MKILTLDISKQLALSMSEGKYLAIPCEADSVVDLFEYVDCEHPGVIIVNADANPWILSDITSLRSLHISTPVIALASPSCLERSDRRANFLEKGGNDLFVKPFDSRELIATAEALYRLSSGAQQGVRVVVQTGTSRIELDNRTRTITVDGQPLELTPMEYNQFRVIIIHCGKVLKLKDIEFETHPSLDVPINNTLQVRMVRIRKKLKAVSEDAWSAIVTVRGGGYCLVGTII